MTNETYTFSSDDARGQLGQWLNDPEFYNTIDDIWEISYSLLREPELYQVRVIVLGIRHLFDLIEAAARKLIDILDYGKFDLTRKTCTDILYLINDVKTMATYDDKFTVAKKYVHDRISNMRCNRCNSPVLITEIPENGYTHQCMYCDEDLYACEIHHGETILDDELDDLYEQTNAIFLFEEEKE